MKVPYHKPWFDEVELGYVRQTLETGYVAQGPYVKDFEKKIAEYTGAQHAVALNSCTSGLFLLAHLLALRPGDEVIVPAYGWISIAHAVEFFGARPVFCDIDIETFNIDPEELKKKITPRTRAVFVAHLFGLCAPMEPIIKIAQNNNMYIIEDCAHGLGAWVSDIHCGNIGAAGVFSFHPRTAITTGEGGMLITNNEAVASKALSLREHGIVPSEKVGPEAALYQPEFTDLGYNMRMTDIQAGIGLGQMDKLPKVLRNKKRMAWEYAERMNDVPWLRAPVTPKGYDHAYQTYCTLFKPKETIQAIKKGNQLKIDRLHEKRNEVMAELEQAGITTHQGAHALHIQTFYQKRYRIDPMEYPAAYAADRLSIALPFYPTITDKEKDYLFSELAEVEI